MPHAVRIWHQSLLVRSSATEPYFKSLESHASAIVSTSCEVMVHGFPASSYPAGVGAEEWTRHQASEPLQDLALAQLMLRAEQEQCDAFAIGTLQDPGLKLGRTIVDIPVVGYGLAAALFARCIGDRIGIVAFNAPLMALMAERLNDYVPGLVGPAVDVGLSYETILRSFGDDSLRESIVSAIRKAIAEGATVIVPGQMLLAELCWRLGLVRVDDVPVIDGLGVLVRLAEALAALQQKSGISVLRTGYRWAKPPASLVDALRSS